MHRWSVTEGVGMGLVKVTVVISSVYMGVGGVSEVLEGIGGYWRG